jgi:hypothetical protein
MSSDSKINEQIEMLKALIELRVIKRDGMDLFFKLEDVYGDIGQLRNDLLAGDKKQKEIGGKLSILFQRLGDELYDLQNLINIGEL